MTESINTISMVKPATPFQIYLWPEKLDSAEALTLWFPCELSAALRRLDIQDVLGDPLNYGFRYFYGITKLQPKRPPKKAASLRISISNITWHRFSHLFCCFPSQLRQVFEGKIPQSRPNGQLNGWIKMKYYKFGQFCSVSTNFFLHLHDHCSVTKVVDK